ncbi:right-handed parallel beta-helix repeat-containing protein [Nonomuraea sp. NPDC001023]|uniref:right-handed parallel beta-helix repeat-containing protein n=2 Tax=unclassified Nonomuraea TaxID=2593643 RepID=UPI00331AC6A8
MQSDIEVVLSDGVYRLEAPIRLTQEDSGGNGFAVRWIAADGASPVISGSTRVTGWTVADAERGIYSAAVPDGARTRNLYVDGRTAPRARTKIPRPPTDRYTADGLKMSSDLAFLKNLTSAQLADVELRSIGSFTDRFNGVTKISDDGSALVMEQPAWKNNTWGWDTFQGPFHDGGYFAENALAFIDEPEEWYLDSRGKKLYFKPSDPAKINELDVELPRLETLLAIGGTTAQQARAIEIDGLTFSGATWNAPTQTGGYVDQQTGGHIDVGPHYPANGYPEFEATRPHWTQIPSAVQISAASDVKVNDTTFTDLGAGGLGIGNDPAAHLSGVGLSAQRVSVTNSRFTAIGSMGITIGGISQQAHHPGTLPDGSRDPNVSDETVAAMTVSEIVVANNRIWDIADTYTSGVGILMTYTQNSTIKHNDVTDVPYSGISLGYGWGANDQGGSIEYRNRGLYKYQPEFSTPTTAKNNRITANYITRYGLMHTDLGGFYNLSANPGTVIAENFIKSTGQAFYPDEGSRALTFNDNVVMSPNWMGPNYFTPPGPRDLAGTGNWVTEGGTHTNPERNNLIEATKFDPAEPPCPVTKTVFASGVPVADRPADDPDRKERRCFPEMTVSSSSPEGKTTVSAEIKDQANDLVGLKISAVAPSGWTLTPTGSVPETLPAGSVGRQTWTVTPPANEDLISRATIRVTATWEDGTVERNVDVVANAKPVQSPFISVGNDGYLASQSGAGFALWQAGKDIWGGGGQHDDEYASIYAPDSFGDGSTMIATVTAQDSANAWSKSGLVVRNDISTPYSAGGYVALVVTPSNGVVLSADRDNDGLLDNNTSRSDVKAPVTLKLQRSGTSVAGSYSKDGGATWTVIGTETMGTPDAKQDAGLIHTSHDSARFGLATFSNLSYDPPVPGGLIKITGFSANYTNPNTAGERTGALFDGTVDTKMYADGFGAPTADKPYEVQWTYSKAFEASKYRLATGNDVPGRDFKSWKLYARKGSSDWALVDTVADAAFGSDRQRYKSFDLDVPGTYDAYKMTVTATASGGDPQMSEIEIPLQ